jgi:hypothetical protein
MTIAALLFTVAYRMTDRVYTGAFIKAIIINWVIVAHQATHYLF